MEDVIEGSGPQDTYHAAFERMDSMSSSLAEEAPATEEGEALHARRRRSLGMMAAMSLNQSCKDAIQDVLLPSSDPFDNAADPTSKFRELLIEAKESGLTWDGIFSNFTPAPETTATISTISQKDFAAGLRKLSSDTSCTLTPVEIDLLLKHFATEKGKQVSLDEVKTFALAIPHVSWKVERIRRLYSASQAEEGTGIGNSTSGKATKPQIKKKTSTTVPTSPAVAFKTTSARSFSRRDSSTVAGKVTFPSSVPAMRTSRSRASFSASDSTSGPPKPPLPRKSSSTSIPDAVPLRSKISPSLTPSPSLVEEPAVTPLVSLGLLATTSKLMWRQQEKLLIQLYSHDSPPRIIAIVAHNEATQEGYPPIYVNRDPIPLNRKAIEALAETKSALVGNEEDVAVEDPSGMTPLQQAERDYLVQYLVQRLVLRDGQEGVNASSGGKHINILPQTGDTWDSLLADRPKLFQPPGPIPGARLVSLQDFHKASAEIAKLTTQTRRHSMAAELYSTMTTTELDDLAAAEEDKEAGEP